ncbi:hypothetical protein RB653_001177 [Dictyostelium firmibasis]|uniref:Cytochrome P450 n=1 Tax=Dictyostelium firmibasis TaxID=79012 RepID=A0AAN7UGA4_9MYCE
MFITSILSIIIIILVFYKGIEYLIEKRSFPLVHPIKGIMNGTKPYFIIGDLPLQKILNLRPKLKELGNIYFRWFFWYPIVEIKDINAIQYVYNERSNNYCLYWNLNKSSNFILTGSEIKRFFRIYYCAFNCKDSLQRILPVIKSQVFNFINTHKFQNSTLSTNKDILNFMLKLLSRVYLGSGDEAYHCFKANYKKFNKSYLDFFHYIFPKLLKVPTKFSKKYIKNKNKRSLYQILAMKAYYGVVKQSKDDQREESMLNIIAETSYNDKEGLSLEEIKMPSYLLNVSSIKGPLIMVQNLIFQLIEKPDIESKIRKEIKLVFEKNGKDVNTFDFDDLMEMKYLEATLDEINRLYPPFPKLIPRQTKESDRILGYHIPKGTMISCPVADILRDSSNFQDPMSFKPERQLIFSNPKFASPSITSIQQLNGLPYSSSNSFALHHKSLPSNKNCTQSSTLRKSFPANTSSIIDNVVNTNRVDQLKFDSLNQPKQSLNSIGNCINNNNSSLNVPNIIEINKNNPISNSQYNSYNNLTVEERNQRIIKNLPWGIGSKKCLGKELAKAIVKTIIIIIYSQYTFDRHIDENDEDLCDVNNQPKIQMTFNPEIKPPLLFKSRKLFSILQPKK